MYKNHDSTLSLFYEKLATFSNSKDLNFILGDFNFDAFNHNVYARLNKC